MFVRSIPPNFSLTKQNDLVYIETEGSPWRYQQAKIIVSLDHIHGAEITHPRGNMSLNYKRVPAIDKCFSILALMAEAKRPFGFNEIVRNLGLNKSTVFNILHTLNDLGVLEKGPDALFRRATSRGSGLTHNG